MQGTAIAHFLDGQPNGTGTITAALADTAQPVGIGTRNDGVTKLKGDLAELLVFGSALSPADRLALDNHFGALYGIQVGTLPNISIAAGPGPTVMLSWPTPPQPFTLESAAAVVVAPWTPVTNTVTSAGGTDSVTIDVTAGQQFFRLQKQ